MEITCDLAATDRRRTELTKYLTSRVLAEDFVCRFYDRCKASHLGVFLEGQLHHLGRFYDVYLNGIPFRTVIVGQEYGHRPARVSLADRYDMIMSSARDCRFKAGSGYPPRNPHMKGTTSALRVLFGLPLGSDYESEFLNIGGEECHLFDAFALVDYLLCSATGLDEKMRGLATSEMVGNCREHFRQVIKILEPQIMIVQSDSFWWAVSAAFDTVDRLSTHSYLGTLAAHRIAIAAFSHPSANYPKNWGTNERTPYLLDTVAPTIQSIRSHVLEGAA